MKKIKIFFLLFILVISVSVKGDIMPINRVMQAVIYARLQNIVDYPEITVIGFREGYVFAKTKKAFEIKSGSYFMIQKFFPITFYAVKKDYLSKKDINEIDWKNDKNVLKSNLTIDVKTFKEKTPIKMVQLDFKIVGFTDSTIIINKSGQTNVSK